MKQENETNEKQNSIELQRNAKNEYSWKIKRYYNDDVVDVINSVQAIDEEMRLRFLE